MKVLEQPVTRQGLQHAKGKGRTANAAAREAER